MKVKLTVLGLLFLCGVGAAIALSATTNTVSACATVPARTYPAQTISANTAVIGTIPAKTYPAATSCTTTTYTVPDPSTVTVTTTAGTTTAPPPTTTTAPPPSSEPAPIAGKGYHQVFADEFNTLDRTVWDDHLWYDTVPDPRWAGFQTVHDGEFDLMTSRTFRWNDVPTCPNPPPAGSNNLNCVWPWNEATTFSSNKKFQYGYFEARMKWTNAKGAWPAFWLYSYQHSADANQCTTQAGEVDVMEAQGDDGNVTNGLEGNAFYGTVHSNTNGCNPQDQQNLNNWQDMGVNLAGSWHKYAAVWTSTQVSWYLDDKFVMSAPTYASDNQSMYLLLQMATGGWIADPDATTPDYLHTEVDYVHVWQL